MLPDDGRHHREPTGQSMRGINSYIRGFFSEARLYGFMSSLRQHQAELRQTIDYHFSNHLGGSMSGVFIRLPFSRSSAWLEWREVNCGLGLERAEDTLQVWLGRLDMTFCSEPRSMIEGAAE